MTAIERALRLLDEPNSSRFAIIDKTSLADLVKLATSPAPTGGVVTDDALEAGVAALERETRLGASHEQICRRVYAAMHSLSASDDVAERVVGVIEQYGEGLVPELRIVCDWLINHFRNDEDARAALTASVSGDVGRVIAAIETPFHEYQKGGKL